MWRSAWGWAGPAARRSRIRRTSRGVRGCARRFTNTASAGVSASTSADRPRRSARCGGHRPPAATAGRRRCLDPLPHTVTAGPVQVDVDRVGGRTPRPPAGRCRRGARARRRRAGPPRPRPGRRSAAGRRRGGPRSRRRRRTRGSRPSWPGDDRRAEGSTSMRPRRRSQSKYRRREATLAGDRAPGVAPGGEVGDVAAQHPTVDPVGTGEPEAARPTRRRRRGHGGRRSRWPGPARSATPRTRRGPTPRPRTHATASTTVRARPRGA